LKSILNQKIKDCRFAVEFKKPLIFLEKGANENRGEAAAGEKMLLYPIMRNRLDKVGIHYQQNPE
jgi:hypothetical protein